MNQHISVNPSISKLVMHLVGTVINLKILKDRSITKNNIVPISVDITKF